MNLSIELHSFMESKAKSIDLASAVKIEEPSGYHFLLIFTYFHVYANLRLTFALALGISGNKFIISHLIFSVYFRQRSPGRFR